MRQKKISIIIFMIAVIVVMGIAFLFQMKNHVTLYSDENTTGNSSGNLLNGGLFCELDDKIYFANPYDENTLYSMNSDLGNVKQISPDNVSYLNVAGKYIFYTKRNDKKKNDSNSFLALNSTGLYRMSTKETNVTKLYDNPTQVACLFGNNIYYQHYDQKLGLLLYSAKIDGSTDKKLLDEPCAPYAVANNTIYYTGTKSDHNIHTMNTDGTNKTTLCSGNFTALTQVDDYLYFLDMNANYSLQRMSTKGGTPETLISDRLATYNVSADGSTIYCQIDNGTHHNGLYALDVSTRSLDKLATGNYNHLHLTTDYLFYETYDHSKVYVMDLATNISQELKLDN